MLINWNFVNESKPIHLGPLKTKAYTRNGTRTVYVSRIFMTSLENDPQGESKSWCCTWSSCSVMFGGSKIVGSSGISGLSCCRLAPQMEQIRMWPGLIKVHLEQLHFSFFWAVKVTWPAGTCLLLFTFVSCWKLFGRIPFGLSSFLTLMDIFFLVLLGVWISFWVVLRNELRSETKLCMSVVGELVLFSSSFVSILGFELNFFSSGLSLLFSSLNRWSSHL